MLVKGIVVEAENVVRVYGCRGILNVGMTLEIGIVARGFDRCVGFWYI